MSHVTFDIANNLMDVHQQKADPWKVTLNDTGDETQAWGRLKRVPPHLQEDAFWVNCCHGISNVNIAVLISFHNK